MKNILFIIFIVSSVINAREEGQNSRIEKVEPLRLGNLALPTSQQPGPLFSLGQNIVDKGDIQAFLFPDYHRGEDNKFINVIPNVIYGITKNLSLFVGLPIAAKFENNTQRSSGLEDLFVQLEYAFYNKDTLTHANQATIVGSRIVKFRNN